MGVPVPGETALITAGILAHDGKLRILLVVVIAAAAAITGDNVGYLLGRKAAGRCWNGLVPCSSTARAS